MPQEWIKVWEREYNLHKMDLALRGLNNSYCKQYLGTSFPKALALGMPNGNDAFCFEKRSHARWVRLMLDVFDSPARLLKFFAAYKNLKRDFLRVARDAGVKAPKTNDPAALARLFGRFSAVDIKYVLIGQWMGFHLTDSAEQRAQELVLAHVQNPEAQAERINAILAPEQMSEIRKERKSLLKVALAPARQREALLKKHAKTFEWIPCINVIEPKPWTLPHFRRELAAILKSGTAAAEYKELTGAFARARRAYKKIRQLFPSRDRALLDRVHVMVFIKDDRDDVRRKAYYLATPLYERIAAALGHPKKDILQYTTEEIVRALASGTTIPAPELRKRKKQYALAMHNGRTVVYTGQAYQRWLARVAKYLETSGSVFGIPASFGAVRGTVRIVLNVYSLHKVRKGDILTTIATHPDYLPAMRLASAFVTDEGGLTSHAAIVAREMGKPCIVGTKNATRVFKDGDRVEVDAFRGIVRKIS